MNDIKRKHNPMAQGLLTLPNKIKLVHIIYQYSTWAEEKLEFSPFVSKSLAPLHKIKSMKNTNLAKKVQSSIKFNLYKIL